MSDHVLVQVGTRGSRLARRQTASVVALLARYWPQARIEERVFSTKGDQLLGAPLHAIGGKGLFTAELEAALRDGEIDLAVHSLKDLPVQMPQDLALGAVPARASWHDMVLCKKETGLAGLREGAAVGTSSIRRASQLLRVRPDLRIVDLRGNIETRRRKLLDPAGQYDAIVMAAAAIERMDPVRDGLFAEPLSAEVMLPAPGQGALGVQCRDDEASLALLRPLSDRATLLATAAERGFLEGLGGGCSAPIAALAELGSDGRLRLRGRVLALDGVHAVDIESFVTVDSEAAAAQAGRELAQLALEQGAGDLLTEARMSEAPPLEALGDRNQGSV